MARGKDRLTAAEIAELEEFRLDRRWSYRQLAAEMTEFCGVTMPEPTITKVLTEPGRGLLPTTAHPIRKYLAHIRKPGRPGQRRQEAAR